MKELGLDIETVLPWFPHEQETPFVLVRVDERVAHAWSEILKTAVRRCYITDSLLERRCTALNAPGAEIVAARLPDPGPTMSGDFGEILVYLYQAAKAHPGVAIGPKKWRLKQDRTKPAPHSDVIHFILPTWPALGPRDVLLCSEVKTKATNGASTPITSAIEDSAKDRTSRLARTLVWLKERALTEDFGEVTIAHLDRFINGIDHPPATKRFHAVAVICSSLVDGELTSAPTQPPTDCSVVVISVPQLQRTYAAVFDAARHAIAPIAPVPRAGGGG